MKKEKTLDSSVSLETSLYNELGKASGTLALPKEIFGVAFKSDLVHQVVTSMMSNARAGTADTKSRAEVRGGGKKPWKQKGTGRARHGSTRSPIWKGGGVAHGPLSAKIYKKKINKKMKTKALYMVLAAKYKAGEILFVDSLSLKTGKTKDASKVVKALSGIKGFERLAGKKQTAVITMLEKNDSVFRSLRNLPQLSIELVKDINPVDLLSSKYLVMTNPEESFKLLVARMTK